MIPSIFLFLGLSTMLSDRVIIAPNEAETKKNHV